MSIEKTVNLHEVDGDPRKMTTIVRHLVREYPEAIAYWHESGIDERLPDRVKHKHGVLGHMFGGAIYVESIGWLLEDKGVLTDEQVRETVLANLVHDADKTTDMKFIKMAMADDVSWEKMEQIVGETDLRNKDDVIEELKKSFERYFGGAVDVGERVHVARALVAGRVHKERLAQAGFSGRIIDIQSATEYTGCDEVDYLIDNYDNLSPADRVVVIQKCVVNFVDNGMMESELVDPQTRTEAVFKKSINIALSTAYVKWNDKQETAEEKQIRVGRKVEVFLAGLVGVAPDKFLSELETRVQKRISSV